MLSNHAPLQIAEQFGTLESLFPGRIDLGLGRAPGGDSAAARALRKNLPSAGDVFPQELAELRSYFLPYFPSKKLRAIPGEGLNIPLYLLGSSDFSARLAAAQGLPFAFASHFAPDYLAAALELYRDQFVPSSQLARPHVIVGVNVFAADTDAEAKYHFTSLQQAFVNMVRQTRGPLPPPVKTMEGRWNEAEEAHVQHMLQVSVVGSPQDIQRGLQRIVTATAADELILTTMMYDHAARRRSLTIAAEAMKAIQSAPISLTAQAAR